MTITIKNTILQDVIAATKCAQIRWCSALNKQTETFAIGTDDQETIYTLQNHPNPGSRTLFVRLDEDTEISISIADAGIEAETMASLTEAILEAGYASGMIQTELYNLFSNTAKSLRMAVDHWQSSENMLRKADILDSALTIIRMEGIDVPNTQYPPPMKKDEN